MCGHGQRRAPLLGASGLVQIRYAPLLSPLFRERSLLYRFTHVLRSPLRGVACPAGFDFLTALPSVEAIALAAGPAATPVPTAPFSLVDGPVACGLLCKNFTGCSHFLWEPSTLDCSLNTKQAFKPSSMPSQLLCGRGAAFLLFDVCFCGFTSLPFRRFPPPHPRTSTSLASRR